ncbi:MAG: hypothetical protein ACOCUQ_03030 [Bacteroidota bacterium]
MACYQRSGREKRIHGLWSAGVGGHIDFTDADQTEQSSVFQIFENCAFREINEEFKNPSVKNLKYIGVINEELTRVGKVHTGIVYLADLEEPALPQSELQNLQWKYSFEIVSQKVELWTKLAIRLLIHQKL